MSGKRRAIRGESDESGTPQMTPDEFKMNEAMEIMRGSGNVFHDFGHPKADVEQTKAILAAKIIGLLDEAGLSTRQAEAITGVNHSAFARIRRLKLDRFTIDRLITLLNRFHQRVEFEVRVWPAQEKEEKEETSPGVE